MDDPVQRLGVLAHLEDRRGTPPAERLMTPPIRELGVELEPYQHAPAAGRHTKEAGMARFCAPLRPKRIIPHGSIASRRVPRIGTCEARSTTAVIEYQHGRRTEK